MFSVVRSGNRTTVLRAKQGARIKVKLRRGLVSAYRYDWPWSFGILDTSFGFPILQTIDLREVSYLVENLTSRLEHRVYLHLTDPTMSAVVNAVIPCAQVAEVVMVLDAATRTVRERINAKERTRAEWIARSRIVNPRS